MASETPKPRQWKRPNGETIVEGTFLKLSANNARLRRADGRIQDIPLAYLSREDLAFIFAHPQDASLVGL